jgi:ubiquinone/menaquinone biosynthesis C-methylase UbiE
MNRDEYKFLYELEEHHWWFAGMRKIVRALLDSAPAPGSRCVLDAGCGTGFTMSWLRGSDKETSVYGLDFSADALAYCRQRGEKLLVRGSVGALPFPAQTFDLIVTLDVLDWFSPEQAPQPFAELTRVLKEGGLLLVRLPAFQFLRGAHDDAIRTVHRYSSSELDQSLVRQGLLPLRVTYANTFLFPIAAVWRVLHRSPQKQAHSDVRPLPKYIRWLNPILAWILGVEAGWLRHLPWSLPAGLSVIALARKPSSG